ncbi:MAG TPA: arginine deiminase-related protein [Candidatus Binatia bacterium]|jgi:N-dimethylarginine dimethylaminohydrolase|nr:arginine deiminase-related protein [Candidatus Binatia bacterium]
MAGTRIVLMGDPTYFSIRAGANPHTRSAWGRRKSVDRNQAIAQWHAFARLLGSFGVRVLVVPADPVLTGLVYPANAGFLFPFDTALPVSEKTFYLANLLPARAGEQPVYERFLTRCGFRTARLQPRFEGEADFFPVGKRYVFTYGRVETQRFRFRLGLPPYERVYGFRSEIAALSALQQIVADREVVPLELCNEAYYHGDTALCAFGPERRFLLAYLDALVPAAAQRLQMLLKDELIALGAADAALYAANSFTLNRDGKHYLFMPAGVSETLRSQVRERGVEPVVIDVSEFLHKGGGAVKCMIADLGPDEETGLTPEQRAFRREHDYQTLFSQGWG